MSHCSFKCWAQGAPGTWRSRFLVRGLCGSVPLIVCSFAAPGHLDLIEIDVTQSTEYLKAGLCIYVGLSDNRQNESGEHGLSLHIHFLNELLNDTLKLVFKGRNFFQPPPGCISFATELFMRIEKHILWNLWIALSNVVLEESLKERQDFRKIKSIYRH